MPGALWSQIISFLVMFLRIIVWHNVLWWQRSERCKSERENWMAKCQPFCNYWLTLLPYSILHCGRFRFNGGGFVITGIFISYISAFHIYLIKVWNQNYKLYANCKISHFLNLSHAESFECVIFLQYLWLFLIFLDYNF